MLRAGIIGCGRITDLHASGYLRSERARIHAICDVDPAVLARRQAEWGASVTYGDFRELLADPDVDLVEIITPHHLHRDMVLEAAAAGKHISVQKPMALSVRECDEMIAAARAAGVRLKVFENFVFFPPYVKAAELIRDGAIGEPLSIRFKLGSSLKGGWPVPLKAWLWRLDEDKCGGGPTLYDDGNHKFSMAIHLLGAIGEVHAWVDRTLGLIDAPALVSWTYQEGGRVGFLDASFSPHMTLKSDYYSADERVEITGTEGVIWLTRCTARMVDEPPLILHRKGTTTAFEDLRSDWLDSFVDSTEHFARCLLGQEQQPLLTGERGREVLQFALAALRSAELGRPVRPDSILE